MLTSRSASSFHGKAVVEYGIAFLTVAPFFLRIGSFKCVERQAVVVVPTTIVSAARRASALEWGAVPEELAAFEASTPIRLIGHLGFLEVRGENACVRLRKSFLKVGKHFSDEARNFTCLKSGGPRAL